MCALDRAYDYFQKTSHFYFITIIYLNPTLKPLLKHLTNISNTIRNPHIIYILFSPSHTIYPTLLKSYFNLDQIFFKNSISLELYTTNHFKELYYLPFKELYTPPFKELLSDGTRNARKGLPDMRRFIFVIVRTKKYSFAEVIKTKVALMTFARIVDEEQMRNRMT